MTDEEIKKYEEIVDHWTKINLKQPPKRRTCHTAFLYGSKHYIVGGLDITERKHGDIYVTDLADPKKGWEKVEYLGDELEKIAYHAGAEINGFYYIVGGQDQTLKTINTIQIYEISQNRLNEKINLDPEVFPPIESHTVLASGQNLIIYGGNCGKDFNQHVYSFNTETKEMTNLTKDADPSILPPPRSDHAAVIYNNFMYVFGGFGPDAVYYCDMWKFDIGGNAWTQVKTKEELEIEEKRRRREEQEKEKERLAKENAEANLNPENPNPENQNPENPNPENTADPTAEKVEEVRNRDLTGEQTKNAKSTKVEDIEQNEVGEEQELNIPKGRSGHSMTVIDDCFYIFGGKTGLIKESNELWKFDPTADEYTLIHETLIEQFTEEELKRISAEDEKGQKPFHWLTRGEVEKRTNPSFLDRIQNIDKKKEENKKKEKEENLRNANKDIQGKYADQVLYRPNVAKMRKTLIFTSDSNSIKSGLNILQENEKANMKPDVLKIKGEIPEPRDGQSVCNYKGRLVVFGGDRFKFPFNDLFFYDLSDNSAANNGEAGDNGPKHIEGEGEEFKE